LFANLFAICSIYAKSLIVYLYDVYQIIWRIQKLCFPNDASFQQNQMKPYLLKLNIKLRIDSSKVKTSTTDKLNAAIVSEKQDRDQNICSLDLGGIILLVHTNLLLIILSSLSFL